MANLSEFPTPSGEVWLQLTNRRNGWERDYYETDLICRHLTRGIEQVVDGEEIGALIDAVDGMRFWKRWIGKGRFSDIL